MDVLLVTMECWWVMPPEPGTCLGMGGWNLEGMACVLITRG